MGLPSINGKKSFTLEEAEEVLPIVLKITEETHRKMLNKCARLDAIKESQPEVAALLDQEIDQMYRKWKDKMEKLGAMPKGMWLADFDNGEGYYCWKYPEGKITHWHGYRDGFLGRKLISRAPQVGNRPISPK